MNSNPNNFDVAVIGAGVFGAWTALHLRRAGLKVLLLDAHGAGNSRASSGGESRIMRLGYGADEIYTLWASRSLPMWLEFIDQRQRTNGEKSGLQGHLFHRTGVLWLGREGNQYLLDTRRVLARVGAKFEELSRSELVRRYSQLDFDEISWALLEPDGGVLMARQLVQAVAKEAIACGVNFMPEAVTMDAARAAEEQSTDARIKCRSTSGGGLPEVVTRTDRRIRAEKFIFACGPWLPQIFPQLLGELITPTRQEVFFFGVPPGDGCFAPPLPVWIDFHELVYAIPDLDGRGYKIAIDRHGSRFDPETGDRVASTEGLREVRKHLARRVPALSHAPVVETRVCQYENTWNGDFLIDRHPEFENVFLVGGGSGHGFKHGPAVGEYVAALVTGRDVPAEPRFLLATKRKTEHRTVY